eukprot:COSAG02_NODE_6368_length_3621_cov_1.933844_4_plen_118_part_00
MEEILIKLGWSFIGTSDMLVAEVENIQADDGPRIRATIRPDRHTPSHASRLDARARAAAHAARTPRAARSQPGSPRILARDPGGCMLAIARTTRFEPRASLCWLVRSCGRRRPIAGV